MPENTCIYNQYLKPLMYKDYPIMEVTTKTAQSILPLVILLSLGKGNIRLCRNIHSYYRINNKNHITNWDWYHCLFSESNNLLENGPGIWPDLLSMCWNTPRMHSLQYGYKMVLGKDLSKKGRSMCKGKLLCWESRYMVFSFKKRFL